MTDLEEAEHNLEEAMRVHTVATERLKEAQRRIELLAPKEPQEEVPALEEAFVPTRAATHAPVKHAAKKAHH